MNEQVTFDDVDELDRQYDIRKAVPGIMDIAQRMLNQSSQIRSRHSGYQEFSYGNASLQTLDYFPSDRSRKLLVYIHGGYWYTFDKAYFSTIGSAWNEVGVSVAIVNYRLAPTVTMKEIVGDVRASIAWLCRHSEKLEFDASEIVVCGNSAGGHLTAMMLATDWISLGPGFPENILKGGVAISGLHDLAPFLKAPFLKDKIRLTDKQVQDYSPARLKPTTSAPLVTCVGGDESPAFHAQNRLIAKCWPEVFRANIPSPGTNHVTVNDELTNPGSHLFKATYELFEQ